jgi:hypothetical protein
MESEDRWNGKIVHAALLLLMLEAGILMLEAGNTDLVSRSA